MAAVDKIRLCGPVGNVVVAARDRG